MDFKKLVEGECGEGNALMKLTQHVTKDQAFHERRLPIGSSEDFKSLPHDGVLSSGEQLVEDFMNETKQVAPNTFRMDSLLQEMREIEQTREKMPPLRGPGVADIASEAGAWAEEFFSIASNRDGSHNDNWIKEFNGMQQPTFNYDINADPTQWTNEFLVDNYIDDATTVEASSWVEEFKPPPSDPELAKAANQLLLALDDPKFSNTEFAKYVKKVENDNTPSSTSKEWASEFTSKDATNSNWMSEFLGSSEEASGYLEEADLHFNSEKMTEDEKDQFWLKLQDEWSKISDKNEYSWLSEYKQDTAESLFKEYKFEEDNPLKDHPNPLEEGKKRLAEGDLPSAVLLFEAAAQLDPESHEAWYLLGVTHAENEQDSAALSALNKSIEIDGNNLSSWMALATSYTNESYQALACEALKKWIKCNPEYSHLVSPNSSGSESSSRFVASSLASKEAVEEVQDLYIKAANIRPTNNIDPDVQCGLGILFNVTGEYDKAVDCFQAALSARPKDSRLWNKLGATLANGDKTEEAVEAYRNALELLPGFIRCRYNLGIACIKLGAHRVAIDHFLEALNLQNVGRGPNGVHSEHAMSSSIWNTLRMCVSNLNQYDLLPSVDARNLTKLNEVYKAEAIVS